MDVYQVYSSAFVEEKNMSTAPEAVVRQENSLVRTMADKYGLEPEKFYKTVVATLFPIGEGKVPPTPEQVAMFLIVAHKYNLNPFIKEIYAFPAKGGGIIPVVSIDGWITIVQRNPLYNGHRFEESLDLQGNLVYVRCIISRKDLDHPIEMVEYLSECKRNTDPWNQKPFRMLHHKAFIQTARYTFGLGGIFDDDEAERIRDVENAVEERRPYVAPPQRASQAAQAPQPAQPALAEAPPPQTFTQERIVPGKATQSEVVAQMAAPAQEQTERKMESLPVDDVLSGPERDRVLKAGMLAGWTLPEIKAYVYKNFNVQAIGDLKKSQLEQVISEIGAGGRM